MQASKGGVMESTHLKARVICNPAASGGGYDPEVLRKELGDYELEWITTESSGEALHCYLRRDLGVGYLYSRAA